ncbi:hypothetical protein KHA80_20095 [Anaerobacillus sp. HL2]|nr:hypothetical protein KHA80_20095 [Anaerobacillus sp. HL2]
MELNRASAASQQLAASAEETSQVSNHIAVAIGEIADGATTQSDHANEVLQMMQQSSSEVHTGNTIGEKYY